MPVQYLSNDDLRRQYAAGKRAFAGIILSGKDLAGLDLRGVDLTGADLSGVNLRGADLSGATLSHTRFRFGGGTFEDPANLSGANLTEANLTGADMGPTAIWPLRRLDLTHADLTRANLCEANLEGANLSGANLSEAKLAWVTLRDADLEGANLRGAEMGWVDLGGANLTGANWKQATAAIDKARHPLLSRLLAAIDAKTTKHTWLETIVLRTAREGLPEPKAYDFLLGPDEARDLERKHEAASTPGITATLRSFWTGESPPKPALDPRVVAYRAAQVDSRRQWEALVELRKQRRSEKLEAERSYWLGLSGQAFEREVASLLQGLGRSVRSVGGAGDDGVDLIIDGVPAQCKQHQRPQGPAVVREFLGACVNHGTSTGILISSSGLTANAHSFAVQHKILVWDVGDLVEMARKKANRLEASRSSDSDNNGVPSAGYLAGHLEAAAKALDASIGRTEMETVEPSPRKMAETLMNRARLIRSRPELTIGA